MSCTPSKAITLIIVIPGMEGDVTILHQEEPGEIFSPLPLSVDTSVVSTQHNAPAVSVKVGKIPPEHCEDSFERRDSRLFGRESVPSQTDREGLDPHLSSTPSPLTISARDIEAGSLDFTEIVGGLNDSSTSFPLESVTTLLQAGREGASTPLALLHAARTPSGTPAAGPVRVKVSAKKLREIQSPCLSDRSPHLSNLSVPSTDGSTPGALSPKVMSQQGVLAFSSVILGKTFCPLCCRRYYKLNVLSPHYVGTCVLFCIKYMERVPAVSTYRDVGCISKYSGWFLLLQLMVYSFCK